MNDKFFNDEQPPVPIPPVDQAWDAMRQQLDINMPVSTPSTTLTRWWKQAVFATGVVTLSIVAWHQLSTRKAPSKAHINTTVVRPHLSPAENTDSAAVHMTEQARRDNFNDSIQRSEFTGLSSIVKVPPQISKDTSLSSTVQVTPQVSRQIDAATGNAAADNETSGPGRRLVAPPSSVSKAGRPPFDRTKASDSNMATQPLAGALHSNVTTRTGSGNSTGGRPLAIRKRADSKKQVPAAKQPAKNEIGNNAGIDPAHSNEQDNTASRAGQPTAKNVTGESRPPGISPASRGAATQDLSLEKICPACPVYNTRLQPDNHHAVAWLSVSTAGKSQKQKNWSLYLQLPLSIPMNGSSYYFTGPKGKSQPLRHLVHAVRLQRQLGKAALSLDVLPAISNVLPHNTFSSPPASGMPPYADTTKSLLKQFGWGLAMQYHAPSYHNWTLAAGVQASFLRKAVVKQTTYTDTFTQRQYTTIYPATPVEQDSLHRVRISAVSELYYTRGPWQMGLKTVIPLRPAGRTNNKDLKSPVQLEILLRRRLISR
jgi:hypothetical protein